MSEKLLRVTANEVIKALGWTDFSLTRQSENHKIYKNKEVKRVTIPYHAGRAMHTELLRSILRDGGATVERFKKLLK